MVGFGETYLPAFALAVGLGELMAGLISSIPLLAGGVMQMISPAAIRWLGSHKRWVVACATVQAVAFVPFIIAALQGVIGPVVALAVASVYWASGLAAGPAWNTWIGTVVPHRVRARFFATRTRASQAAVLGGFLLGGLSLRYAGGQDHAQLLLAFAILFTVAGCFRLFSVALLGSQSEPVPIPPQMRYIPLGELFAQLRTDGGGRFLVFLAAVQGAVQMAGPYFTPFMLKKLEFGYGQYVVLIAIAYLTKVLSLPMWGRVAHTLGARKLLWVGAVGIAPLSGGWLVSQHFSWLLCLQFFGGVTWAAYELAFFLLFFESIDEDERTSMLTAYNLINTTAWVTGSLIGGLVLFWFQASFQGYLIVFGLSSLARFAALLLLSRLPSFDVQAEEIAVRTVAVRPHSASLDAPVLPSLTENKESAAA
jgi:MFS family permease